MLLKLRRVTGLFFGLDFFHNYSKGSQAEEGGRGELKWHIATSV